jgi:beta-glucuronidase
VVQKTPESNPGLKLRRREFSLFQRSAALHVRKDMIKRLLSVRVHYLLTLATLCLGTLFYPSPALAQHPSLIQNVSGRKTTSLDGVWRIIIDPYENGYYDYRYKPSENGYFKNAKPQSGSDLIEYDFDTSATLKVPGDWNTQSERLLFYEGTIWYKKSFDYRKTENSRLFVYFGAANYEADVYLNGVKIGRHEGGFTPFNFEVTKLIKEQDNYLIVKVDNKRRRDAVPTLNTDWWNYGGLTRQVSLMGRSSVKKSPSRYPKRA